ncbi:MAG: hypothetical protein WA843_03675, partial [Candidatus Saccharimonadales bacterium]
TQPQTVAPGSRPVASSGNPRRSKPDNSKWNRIAGVVLGAAIVVLLIALVAVISFGNDNNQSKYVDNTKLQAVFLNTGQVYFGKISTLNDKYLVLNNIYYLQTSGSSTDATKAANTNVTLVKLGCELHEPYDRMVINSDQVTFWENLQDGGQVAKAVSTFEKQNPQGQKCADQSSSSTNTSSSVQNAGTSATPSTDTTKKP